MAVELFLVFYLRKITKSGIIRLFDKLEISLREKSNVMLMFIDIGV